MSWAVLRPATRRVARARKRAAGALRLRPSSPAWSSCHRPTPPHLGRRPSPTRRAAPFTGQPHQQFLGLPRHCYRLGVQQGHSQAPERRTDRRSRSNPWAARSRTPESGSVNIPAANRRCSSVPRRPSRNAAIARRSARGSVRAATHAAGTAPFRTVMASVTPSTQRPEFRRPRPASGWPEQTRDRRGVRSAGERADGGAVGGHPAGRPVLVRDLREEILNPGGLLGVFGRPARGL